MKVYLLQKKSIIVNLFILAVSLLLNSGCSSLQTNSAIIPTSKLQHNLWKNRHEGILDKLNPNPKLLLIGNSILYTLENDDRETVRAKHLDKYNTLNLGFSGDRTENVIWRLQNGELENINPKVALVLIGINNTDGNNCPTINFPNELEEATWKICEIISEKLPNTEILLMGILPFGRNIPNYRNTINIETNKLVSDFPNRDKYIHYIDISDIYLNSDGKIIKDLMPDYLHPNAEGHMLMFDRLEDEITKRMEK